MNYEQFRKQKDIDLRLLSLLGILKQEHRIIQLDNYPDYDLSSYEGFNEKPYFFRDTWSFANDYSAIINIVVKNVKVFHFDDIKRLSSEYKVPFRYNERFDIVLNRIRKMNPELMWWEGIEPDFDGFKLSEVKIGRVDQFQKIVEFFGGYTGASDSIEPMDWDIVIECSFNGFVSGEHYGKFYADLIAESYALRDAGNYKLSYFIAFTTLENYINERLGTHDKEGRLKDKLSELFKVQFGSLVKHQVYSSVVGEFSTWEYMRNAIAHGKERIEVARKHVDELMVFILTLLSSIEQHQASFDGLYIQLPSNQ
ncbi:hypothetical protein [Xenorhabdus sp. SGI240]|uniref:hypothetical protein n=1 Tax=Xenorhabdus sp. SGI240 TaxID=3158262 RepID=UPI0032B765AF